MYARSLFVSVDSLIVFANDARILSASENEFRSNKDLMQSVAQAEDMWRFNFHALTSSRLHSITSHMYH